MFGSVVFCFHDCVCNRHHFPSCSTVSSAWKRFDKLHEAYAATVLADTGEAFADLYDVDGYGKVDGVKLPVDFIIDNFEELKVCKACSVWIMDQLLSCISVSVNSDCLASTYV